MVNDKRNKRLAADYREMLKIQDRPYLSWIVTKGEPPYAEEYLLSIRLRTYALCVIGDRYAVGVMDHCTVKVTLWDSYPTIAPNIRMLNIPPVFAPSWYSKGTYSPSAPWQTDGSLKDYVLQMLKGMIYDPSAIDPAAPANYKALDWYNRNRDNAALFPSDRTELDENRPEDVAAIERAAVFDEIIDSWPIQR